MKPSAYVENAQAAGSTPRLTNQFYQDCLTALGGGYDDAAMVLDDCGVVLYGNSGAGAILNAAPDGLPGRHISDFILNLRLNAWTPGSNVAYATYTGKRNQWHEYCVLDSAGRGFPVELLLDVLVVDLRYLILLWVRTPATQSEASKPSRARPLPIAAGAA